MVVRPNLHWFRLRLAWRGGVRDLPTYRRGGGGDVVAVAPGDGIACAGEDGTGFPTEEGEGARRVSTIAALEGQFFLCRLVLNGPHILVGRMLVASDQIWCPQSFSHERPVMMFVLAAIVEILGLHLV